MRHLCAALVIAISMGLASMGRADDLLPHVLVLGTFHWSNPGRDIADVRAPDLSSPRRRHEVAELLEVIRRYRPTRIAVELLPGEVGERFHAFTQHPRVDDEVDQIGFRLARQLHHRAAFGVDCPDAGEFATLVDAAKQYGQSALLDSVVGAARRVVAADQTILDEEPLLAYYRHLNSTDRIGAGDHAYLTVALVGTAKAPVGARVTGSWYERNLCIYANIIRLLDRPEERLLVVIGSGHLKLLNEYLRESGRVHLDRFEDLLVPTAK